jgi:hypothetical protein
MNYMQNIQLFNYSIIQLFNCMKYNLKLLYLDYIVFYY